MNRILSFIKTSEYNYWPHLIILLFATVADVAFIVFSWEMGARPFVATCIFLGLFLLWPALALLAGMIYVFIDTRKPVNRQEKVLQIWLITLLLALLASLIIGKIYNDHARIYYTLPNNDAMTIWQERIIFEKYTSCLPPHSNYIELPRDLYSWELIIDAAGRSAIIGVDSNEIKQVSPKYPVVATYVGSAGPGRYWSRTEFPPERWMAHIEFNFYPDAFSTGGYLQFTTVTNDSVYHLNGCYPFTQYRQYKESFGGAEPLDSFIVSFHEQTHYYRFWADSTQYSAFH